MLEEIFFKKKLYAIIIKNKFSKKGVNFLTNNSLSQQIAHMQHEKGHKIDPHFHKKWTRQIDTSMEALIIKSGKLRVDFYTISGKYFVSKILDEKDVILLIYGGHGFEVLKKTSMIEIKQGPFTKDTRNFFRPVDKRFIKIEK